MSLIHINPIFVGEIPHEKYFMVHPFTHEFLAFTLAFLAGIHPQSQPKARSGLVLHLQAGFDLLLCQTVAVLDAVLGRREVH